MKKEAILDYYIYNGKVLSTQNSEGFDEVSSPSIYEVIRVIDGVPLFFEEHIERMRSSAELLGGNISKDNSEILCEIKRLIDVNKSYNLNIKIVFSKFNQKDNVFLVYFIKSYYPEKEIYEKGVHTILFKSVRENPNIKVLNTGLKGKINRKLEEENAFEALLVNEKGYITEGSRSNIFFVKDNYVYTAPKGDVLLGITRHHIINVCKELNINVIEENIHIAQLNKIDGVFMTGTSVNVLPITSIEHRRYNSVDNNIISRVRNSYLEDMEKYIKKSRKYI